MKRYWIGYSMIEIHGKKFSVCIAKPRLWEVKKWKKYKMGYGYHIQFPLGFIQLYKICNILQSATKEDVLSALHEIKKQPN